MEQSNSTAALESNLSTYLWEVPGKPVSIHLRLDIIDRMTAEMLRGLGALKRRGAEVGGLLLGRSEPGSPRQVWIEEYEPIPSEYLTGPSYRLSANDLVALEAAIARRRAHPEARLSVVGLYRSHTRDELFMDDDDLAVARRYFSDPGNVFLIVKPFMMRSCIGGFFIWENGEIFRRSSYQQFPFHRRDLSVGGVQSPRATRPHRAEPPAPSAAPAPPPPPPVAEPPAPEPLQLEIPPSLSEIPAPARQYSSLSILAFSKESVAATTEEIVSTPMDRRLLLVPAFICLASIGGYVAYRSLNEPKAPEPSRVIDSVVLPLRLSVEEKDNQLDVTWDRSAQAVVAANRGLLSISDGAATRNLELSGPQLRSGRVLYSKLSGDVTLRLEVYPEGQDPVRESIRILSTDPAVRPKPPSTSTPTPAAQPSRALETPADATKKAARPRPERRAPVARRKDAVEPPAAAPEPPPQPEIELQGPERRR